MCELCGTPEDDEILVAETRSLLRDEGLDEGSVEESIAVMRDQGMFRAPD